MKNPYKIIKAVAGALIMLCAFSLMAVSFGGCTSKPEAGEIGVVRNGGPFDNKNIKKTIPNGSGMSWVGFFSDTHYYPVESQQRFFRMASCGQGRCKGADSTAVIVPTKDGVDVAIEGTFYLNTLFNNSSEGMQAVKDFDTQFSTRTFDGLHAYEGAQGWEHFLAAIVEPIVVNNLREVVSNVSCADLVSSCALVQNSGGSNSVKTVAEKDNLSKINQVQKTVQDGLTKDLDDTLRRQYFGNIQFKLSRVVLPNKIQGAINEAQSAFAQVSQAQAKVQSAKAEAQANEERQKGYNRCPACQKIDIIKALPKDLQALGGNMAIGIK